MRSRHPGEILEITLEALSLDERREWKSRGVLEGRANVRAAPFDADLVG